MHMSKSKVGYPSRPRGEPSPVNNASSDDEDLESNNITPLGFSHDLTDVLSAHPHKDLHAPERMPAHSSRTPPPLTMQYSTQDPSPPRATMETINGRRRDDPRHHTLSNLPITPHSAAPFSALDSPRVDSMSRQERAQADIRPDPFEESTHVYHHHHPHPSQTRSDPFSNDGPVYQIRQRDPRSDNESKIDIYPSNPPPSRSHQEVSSYNRTLPVLNPYLGLPTRLSLTLLSLPLLSLLLSISTLLSASSSTDNMITSAKNEIIAKCAGANQALQWLQSGVLARLMAEKVNEELVRGIKATLNGLRFILVASLTIIEKVLGFFIDMYRSLLFCTIEFVVRATLAVLIGAVQTITDGVTTALNTIRNEIQDQIAGANKVISVAVAGINLVTNLVDVNLDVPQFSIPALTSLQDVVIPSTFEDDLVKMNASIPSLDELRTTLDAFIAVPFKSLKTSLSGSFLDVTSSFNASILPVPTLKSANATSTDICAGIDTQFLDDVGNSIAKLVKLGIGLIILSFFLGWCAYIAWEGYVWKKMKEQQKQIEMSIQQDHVDGRAVNGMQIMHLIEHPVLERHLSPTLPKISKRREIQDNWRWFFTTISHGPALALLIFASFSFLVLQFQIIAVHGLRDKSTADVSSAVSVQSATLSNNLNDALFSSSKQYAQDVNHVLQGWQNRIDNEIFGPWLNTTTVVLNGTLVEFYGEIEDLLNKTLGRTVLAGPMNTFAYCILGSKVEAVEIALTWIHENAHVTLPKLKDDVLMMSNSTMQNISTPIAEAMSGTSNGRDNDGGVVGRIFDTYESALKKQRTAALLLLALYCIAVFVAILVMAYHSWIRDAIMQQRMQGLREAKRIKFNCADVPEKNTTAHGQENSPLPDIPKVRELVEDMETVPSSPWSYAQHATRSAHTPSLVEDVSGVGPTSFSNTAPVRPQWSARISSLLAVPKINFGGSLHRNDSKKSEQSWIAQSWSPHKETSGYCAANEEKHITDLEPNPLPRITFWENKNSHPRGRSITQPFVNRTTDPFKTPFDD